MRLGGWPGAEGQAGVSEEHRDPAQELEDQMRAADKLIKRLEEEVSELRRDLDQAGAALRTSREEVAARTQAVEDFEESERSRAAAEEEVRALRKELMDLRQQSADELLALRNQHIAEVAALREELDRLRDAEATAAEAESKVSALREEYRKERATLEERHEAEVEEIKRTAEQWEEKLREDYQNLEERHKAETEELAKAHAREVGALRKEIEALRVEAEEQKIELERTLREALERRFEEEVGAERERHAEELQTLRSDAAGRELELQKQLSSEIEARRVEAEELRLELEKSAAEAEERRQADLSEVKRLAEGHERELRREQAARLAEEREAAERRIEAMKAQKDADINTLQERHAEKISLLEERLENLGSRQETEMRLYEERLKELEREKVAQKGANEEELERWVAEREEERSRLEDRVAELQEALEESGALEAELREALEASRVRNGKRQEAGTRQGRAEETNGRESEWESEHRMYGDLERRLGEVDAARLLAEERAADLEERLRSGISLFNTSEHTRAVASISKALGLPKVHVGADGGSGSSVRKPVITFVWSDMAWRRYVSDPTEGVEEPRVYLIGAGDEPSDIDHSGLEPNARMDAQGRLILGIQAW